MTADQGQRLVALARRAIEATFARTPIAPPDEPWLRPPGAVFVTLRSAADHDLRGCVGTIEPVEPLGQAVITAATNAAFHDGRFPPLDADELPRVVIDVSVLAPAVPLPVVSEAAAIAQIERSRPGMVFRDGWRRSVLLPQVWESVRDGREFLRHLKLKAGLPPTYWSTGVQLSVFTVEEFAEPPRAMRGARS